MDKQTKNYRSGELASIERKNEYNSAIVIRDGNGHRTKNLGITDEELQKIINILTGNA